MGAKKDKDIKILDHQAKKFKQKAKDMKKFKIDSVKIAKIEAKQARYENWLAEVQSSPDY